MWNYIVYEFAAFAVAISSYSANGTHSQHLVFFGRGVSECRAHLVLMAAIKY
jgi:hypothetical protein